MAFDTDTLEATPTKPKGGRHFWQCGRCYSDWAGAYTVLVYDGDHLIVLDLDAPPELLYNAGVTPQQFFDKLTSLGTEIYFIDEANGIVPIAVGDGSSLVNRLLASETSGNILCTWGSTKRELLLKI